jgi:hypothetical protein
MHGIFFEYDALRFFGGEGQFWWEKGRSDENDLDSCRRLWEILNPG